MPVCCFRTWNGLQVKESRSAPQTDQWRWGLPMTVTLWPPSVTLCMGTSAQNTSSLPTPRWAEQHEKQMHVIWHCGHSQAVNSKFQLAACIMVKPGGEDDDSQEMRHFSPCGKETICQVTFLCENIFFFCFNHFGQNVFIECHGNSFGLDSLS